MGNEGSGQAERQYSWRQDALSVEVVLPVPPGVDAKAIEWRVTPTPPTATLTLAVDAGAGLRDVELYHGVVPAECHWQLEGEGDDRRVVATLQKEGRGEWPCLLMEDERRAAEVYLNVYDVTPALNVVLGSVGFGVHHTGVEVYGHEFCFGREDEGCSGVRVMMPRGPIGHEFREALPMGRTPLSRAEVFSLVRVLFHLWDGSRYHLTRCNCNHFAEALVRQLLAPEPPAVPQWVNRAARGCDAVLPGDMLEKVNLADAAAFEDMKRRLEAERNLSIEGPRPEPREE